MPVWRMITGWPYEVSNRGQVRNIRTGHILKPQATKGYLRVTLCSGGQQTRRRCHQLVWEAFRGPIPSGKEINHENGIKTDNDINNLSLMTSAENAVHAITTGLRQYPPKMAAEERARRTRITTELWKQRNKEYMREYHRLYQRRRRHAAQGKKSPYNR